jgi:hypothetical protein
MEKRPLACSSAPAKGFRGRGLDYASPFTAAWTRDLNNTMALRAAEWYKLPTSLTELCINTTLRCGQSFR